MVAGLATALVVGILFFGGTLSALWDRSSKPVPGVLTPPGSSGGTSTTTFDEPTSEANCKDDPGYASYTELAFANEHACITYVHEHRRP